MSAVLESVDSGEDLGGSPNATPAGGADTARQPDQGTLPDTAGGSTQAAGGADTGITSGGAGGDAQPTAGSSADGKDKLVPLSALHEARSELRALRTKIAELEAKPSLTPQQQAQLDKLNAQETAVTQKDPDFLEDPKGYVDSALKKTQDAVKKLDEATQKQAQQQEQQQQLNQILSGVQQHEAAFMKATPDYTAAVDHIRAVRSSQLQMLYPQATPEQISRHITTEEVAAAAQILRSGGNPAEYAYNYAKTMGYTPKQATPSNQAANGATPPDKDAVRTLGNGGGADNAEEPADDELGSAMKSALAERFGVRKRR